MPSSIRSLHPFATVLSILGAIVLVTLPAAAQSEPTPSANVSTTGIVLQPRTDAPVDMLYNPGDPVRKQYEDLQVAFGVRVLFDPRFPEMPTATPEILQVDLFEALQILTTSHGHFYKVLDPETILIAADTPQQRRQHDEQTIQSFYLENTRVADGMTLLRSLLGLKHVAAHEGNRTLTVRDTVDTVAVARDLIAGFDHPAAEIELEVLLLDIEPSRLATGVGDSPQRLTPSELEDLLATGSLIERSSVAAIEGHRARLEISNHLPLPLGDSPTIRLGVELRATPHVHGESGEISLDLGLAVQTVSGWLNLDETPRPVLGKHHVDSNIRLDDEATWLLRGFSGTAGGPAPAGFDQLDTLGRWLTGQAPAGREMALALTARVVRGPGHEAEDLRPHRVGTETRVVHHGGQTTAP